MFIPAGETTAYGDRALDSFTEDAIEAFFGHLRAKGFAQSTVNKYIQMTKALFRWAVKKGYLTRNPAADSEALKRRKIMRKARSKKQRPALLADLERRYRELPSS